MHHHTCIVEQAPLSFSPEDKRALVGILCGTPPLHTSLGPTRLAMARGGGGGVRARAQGRGAWGREAR